MHHPFRRLLAALAAVALSAPPLGAQPAPAGYERYTNARFGFTVEIPSGLRRDRAPDDGDGQAFRSRDGGLRLAVSAIGNASGEESLDPALTDASVDCLHRPPEYLMRQPDSFTLSCFTPSGILYARTIRRGRGEAAVFTDLRITYPVAERARWDPVVARVARSLRAAPPFCDPAAVGC